MNIGTLILLTGLLCLSGCELDNSGCSSLCTTEFRIITVAFKDQSGKPVIVDDYEVINQRTGLQIQTPKPDTVYFKGIYVVASDADIMQLSGSGDPVLVTAKNPDTNEQVSAMFTIAGGECNCHVFKKAGPNEIIFK